MAKTKIGQLFELYEQNAELSNIDASELLKMDVGMIRTMKSRLKQNGYIEVADDGKVSVLKPYHERGYTSSTAQNSAYKSQIYLEMVGTYMEDFRAQTTFNERLTVGREIRLLLEKM